MDRPIVRDPLRDALQTSLGNDSTLERELRGGGMGLLLARDETRGRAA